MGKYIRIEWRVQKFTRCPLCCRMDAKAFGNGETSISVEFSELCLGWGSGFPPSLALPSDPTYKGTGETHPHGPHAPHICPGKLRSLEHSMSYNRWHRGGRPSLRVLCDSLVSPRRAACGCWQAFSLSAELAPLPLWGRAGLGPQPSAGHRVQLEFHPTVL